MLGRLAVAALITVASAQASAFDFELEGTADTLWSPFHHPGCLLDPINTPGCLDVHHGPWTGSLHLETDSLADGVYTGEHLLSFDFTSNLTTYPDPGLPGQDGPPTVTLAGGQVVGIAVHSDGMSSFFDVTGFEASLRLGQHEADQVTANGVLVAVPEPEIYALLLCGLGAMAAIRRRRKA